MDKCIKCGKAIDIFDIIVADGDHLCQDCLRQLDLPLPEDVIEHDYDEEELEL